MSAAQIGKGRKKSRMTVARLNHCAVIATHHKTGTVWMRKVFRAIASLTGTPFFNMNAIKSQDLHDIMAPAILLNDHSNFRNAAWIIGDDRFRIMHVIRDPRDVVVSAMHYHCTAPEEWLHRKRPMFKGLTYQEKINSLPDDRARYLFEMQHTAGRVIKDMRNWDYNASNSIECRYETLMADIEMVAFSRALTYLGFDDSELDGCRGQIWEHSLFGSLLEKRQDGAPSTHIRSGEVRQWPDIFDGNLGQSFLDRFGDVLIELGYENDHSWVQKLPSADESRSST
jgi:hypothetical protein